MRIFVYSITILCSFSKYLSRAQVVLNTLLGTGDTAMSQKILLLICSSSRKLSLLFEVFIESTCVFPVGTAGHRIIQLLLNTQVSVCSASGIVLFMRILSSYVKELTVQWMILTSTQGISVPSGKFSKSTTSRELDVTEMEALLGSSR